MNRNGYERVLRKTEIYPVIEKYNWLKDSPLMDVMKNISQDKLKFEIQHDAASMYKRRDGEIIIKSKYQGWWAKPYEEAKKVGL